MSRRNRQWRHNGVKIDMAEKRRACRKAEKEKEGLTLSSINKATANYGGTCQQHSKHFSHCMLLHAMLSQNNNMSMPALHCGHDLWAQKAACLLPDLCICVYVTHAHIYYARISLREAEGQKRKMPASLTFLATMNIKERKRATAWFKGNGMHTCLSLACNSKRRRRHTWNSPARRTGGHSTCFLRLQA